MIRTFRGARLPVLLLFGTALSSVPAVADQLAEPISYSLGGLVEITARENAASKMLMGLWARIEVAENGSVTGEGIIRYESAAPCQWRPPEPNNGKAPYCRIDELVDGNFKVTGELLETVHRHDDENPLKNAIFDLADKNTDTRPGYAPSRLRLRLEMDRQPRELLSLWGFSTPNVQQSYTGAATLGLLSSGGIGTDFEITPISTDFDANSDGGEPVFVARQHVFGGRYQGNTPVISSGSYFFVELSADQLPRATHPGMYLSQEDNAPKPRDLSESEIAAMEAYQENGYQPPSRLDEVELESLLNALPATGAPGSTSGSGAVGIGLTDDTRAN